MSRTRLARSHAVLTTAALVAALGLGAEPAVAAPQSPNTASEAAQRLRDLSRKAEVLTEDYKRAQDKHRMRKADLARATADAVRAQQAAARARAAEQRLRGKVDQLTESSYQGAKMNTVSALISSGSPDEYLDRASLLGHVAGDHDAAVDRLAQATRQAETAEKQARAARDAAAKAEADAARLRDEIARRKDAMDSQIARVKQQYNSLSSQEKESLSEGSSSDVGSIAGSGAAVKAVNAALSKQGSPYVWGAKGPDEFDCSGLVQWSYEQAGVDLPASTRSQINEGREVSTSNIKPGDVIFYYSSGSHNAIYIGNGKAVHAPTSGQNVSVDGYKDIGDINSVRRIAG